MAEEAGEFSEEDGVLVLTECRDQEVRFSVCAPTVWYVWTSIGTSTCKMLRVDAFLGESGMVPGKYKTEEEFPGSPGQVYVHPS